LPPSPRGNCDLLDALHRWFPDEADRRRILVDNPARLYGFP
jgi:predicted TIM-barrel fold metal-dependent hydrolase